METKYGWVITADTINDDACCVGIMGPRSMSADVKARLNAGEGKEWRCLDDDDNVYFSGRLIQDEGNEEDLLSPLDNFAGPDSGCTSIQYKSGDVWETV